MGLDLTTSLLVAPIVYVKGVVRHELPLDGKGTPKSRDMPLGQHIHVRIRKSGRSHLAMGEFHNIWKYA